MDAQLKRLVFLKVTGKKLTESESEQLQKWILEHPGELESITKIWDSYGTMKLATTADPQEDWELLLKRSQAKRTSFSIWKIAASLTILALIGAALILSLGRTTYSHADAKGGGIVLQDGSTIWLSEETTVKVPWNYGIWDRQLMLEGQAFFDIKHSPDMSLEVVGSSGIVRVLGTEFQYYATDSIEEVSLISGKVNYAVGGESYTLLPDKRITWNQGKVTQRTMHNKNFIFWKSRRLEFDQVPLAEILEELAIHYQVTISYTPTEMDCPISIVFDNQSIDEVLSELSFVGRFSFSSHSQEFKIETPSCK